MRRVLRLLALMLSAGAAMPIGAHVGSADVYYEGDAGPYHLFVTVRLPKVIPGIADLEVRSNSPEVTAIQIVLLRLTGPGSKYPPVPDESVRSADDPQFYTGKLWIMEYGALQVRLDVTGSKGKATLAVPIASFAREPAAIDPTLRFAVGSFLTLLMLSVVPVVGSLVRDGSIAGGDSVPAGNRRRSNIVMAIVLASVVTILFLNRQWWDSEAATYQRAIDLLKPPRAEVKLLNGNELTIRPASPLLVPVAGGGQATREVKIDEVIPDHGHPIHVILLRLPEMDELRHLHPNKVSGAFTERLPAMPAGKYQVYADIVDKNGFPWTLVGDVQLPSIAGNALEGDDSGWHAPGAKKVDAGGKVVKLLDGGRLIWEQGDGPVTASQPARLKFRVENDDGSPARDLQPYMGMVSHTLVVCTDLSVFAHLHSNGSVPMAALDLAQAGPTAQTPFGIQTSVMSMDHSGGMMHASEVSPEFNVPYGFPHAGQYRIFVQIKRRNQVQTAVFDTDVR